GNLLHSFYSSDESLHFSYGFDVAGLEVQSGPGRIAVGSISEGVPFGGGRVFLIRLPEPPSQVENWFLLK
ncbi:MAG: hypothetical protein KC931_24930, partial [Candidatus Omnitrophica bacterium]|nr:hypothetical protein [Candidatus Omnitrophota bacterium]